MVLELNNNEAEALRYLLNINGYLMKGLICYFYFGEDEVELAASNLKCVLKKQM